MTRKKPVPGPAAPVDGYANVISTADAGATVEDSTPSNPLDRWLMTYLGPLALWLKNAWLLAIPAMLASVGLVSVQWLARDDTGAALPAALPFSIALGVLVALLVLFDKFADRFERLKKAAAEQALRLRSDAILRASEEFARNSVSDLNTVIEAAHEVAFLEKAPRAVQMANLRRILVMSAAKSVGPGSRATYYTLDGERGHRILGAPIHAVEYGRDDRPDRPFLEAEDGELILWSTLERSDTEPPVYRKGDDLPGMDWSRKAYASFISVPVKAKNVVFGLLSVNSSSPDAIGAAQRATIIAMARTLALVESMDLGPRTAVSRQAAMSEGGDTLNGIEQLEAIAQMEEDK